MPSVTGTNHFTCAALLARLGLRTKKNSPAHRPRGVTTAQLDTAQRVLGIPELLEPVLQYTSIKDVLSLLRVSRRIHDIIEASSKLQIRLCMQAGNPADIRTFYSDAPDSGLLWRGVIWGPLLEYRMSPAVTLQPKGRRMYRPTPAETHAHLSTPGIQGGNAPVVRPLRIRQTRKRV